VVFFFQLPQGHAIRSIAKPAATTSIVSRAAKAQAHSIDDHVQLHRPGAGTVPARRQ